MINGKLPEDWSKAYIYIYLFDELKKLDFIRKKSDKKNDRIRHTEWSLIVGRKEERDRRQRWKIAEKWRQYNQKCQFKI